MTYRKAGTAFEVRRLQVLIFPLFDQSLVFTHLCGIPYSQSIHNLATYCKILGVRGA
jgi:hypothetical protein